MEHIEQTYRLCGKTNLTTDRPFHLELFQQLLDDIMVYGYIQVQNLHSLFDQFEIGCCDVLEALKVHRSAAPTRLGSRLTSHTLKSIQGARSLFMDQDVCQTELLRA